MEGWVFLGYPDDIGDSPWSPSPWKLKKKLKKKRWQEPQWVLKKRQWKPVELEMEQQQQPMYFEPYFTQLVQEQERQLEQERRRRRLKQKRQLEQKQQLRQQRNNFEPSTNLQAVKQEPGSTFPRALDVDATNPHGGSYNEPYRDGSFFTSPQSSPPLLPRKRHVAQVDISTRLQGCLKQFVSIFRVPSDTVNRAPIVVDVSYNRRRRAYATRGTSELDAEKERKRKRKEKEEKKRVGGTANNPPNSQSNETQQCVRSSQASSSLESQITGTTSYVDSAETTPHAGCWTSLRLFIYTHV